VEFSYEGSYSTVRDFVRKLKPTIHQAYMVLHYLPGEEARVDFGYIGTIPVDRKLKKAWVFVHIIEFINFRGGESVPPYFCFW